MVPPASARPSARKLVPWLLALLVATAVAAAEEKPAARSEKTGDEKKPSPYAQAARSKAAAGDQAPTVYTTEDLERMFAEEEKETTPEGQPAQAETPAPPAVEAAKPEAPEAAPPEETDPLKRLQQRQAERAERETQIAEAEKQVAALEQRVKELEKRILATKNPFLARPEVSEDERQEWDGQDGAARVRSSEDKLRQARGELQKAREELARLSAGG